MKMRKFVSGGATVLQELAALNENVAQGDSGPTAHRGLMFGKIIIPLATKTLDACFDPIRREIRRFAKKAHMEKSKSVLAALNKLRADEKAKKATGTGAHHGGAEPGVHQSSMAPGSS